MAIAHEQTIICGQLFAGHVVGSRPMKRKKKLLRMIIVNCFPGKRHCILVRSTFALYRVWKLGPGLTCIPAPFSRELCNRTSFILLLRISYSFPILDPFPNFGESVKSPIPSTFSRIPHCNLVKSWILGIPPSSSCV